MDDYDKALATGSTTEAIAQASLGAKKWSAVTDPFDAFLVAKYTLASPENRALMRAEAEQDIQEATDNPIYKGAEKFNQWVKNAAPVDPELAESFWLSDVPNAFGSLALFAAGGVLSRGAALRYGGKVITPKAAGFIGPAALGAGANRSGVFSDAIAEGATIKEALDVADLGAIVGVSEAAPISRMLERADKIAGGVIKKALIRITKQGTEEAIQEAGIEIANNLIAMMNYDPERGFWTEEVTTAGEIGFTTGALLETLITLLPGRRRGTARRGAADQVVPTDVLERLDAGEITIEEAIAQTMAAVGDDAAAGAGGDTLGQTAARAEAQRDAAVALEDIPVLTELPPGALPVAPEAIEGPPEPPLLTDGVPPPPEIAPLPVPEEGATESEIRELFAARAEEEATELERAARPEADVGVAFEARERAQAAQRAVQEGEARAQRVEQEVEAAAAEPAEEPRPTLAAVTPPEVAALAAPLPQELEGVVELTPEGEIEPIGEPTRQTFLDLAEAREAAEKERGAFKREVWDDLTREEQADDTHPDTVRLTQLEDRAKALNRAERAIGRTVFGPPPGEVEAPPAAAEIPTLLEPPLPALAAPTAITVTPEGVAIPPGAAPVITLPGAPTAEEFERAPAQAARAQRLSERRSVRGSGELPSTQDLASPRYADLEGIPDTFDIPGRGEVKFGRHVIARDAAHDYTEQAGLDYRPARRYAKLSRPRARRIANEFDAMEHRPNDPEVLAAYRQMIEETAAQYQVILDTGLQIEFITGEDPYAGNPRLAILDIVENNHFSVYSTREGFGTREEFDPSESPLLEESGFEISGRPALNNDLFRVVHDFFGHVKDGVGFRAEGEENAWQSHAAMYSPLARRAMTVETRGQNSWVNFGPSGEFNRTASGADTIYADQKMGLLPEWVSEQGMQRAVAPEIPTLVEVARPEVPTAEQVQAQAETAATSPTSEQPTPTAAQLQEGNYYKPPIRLRPGLTVRVENAAGTVREIVDRFGTAIDITMQDTYGYIEGTEAADGDPLDAFIGDQPESERVFIVDQIDQETGEFDEHKVMLAYPNAIAAKRAYKRNYESGWKVGPMTEMSMEEFQQWSQTGDLSQPASRQAEATPVLAPGEFEDIVDRQRLRRGRRTPVRYRLDDDIETTAPPFYSKMREVLEEMLPAQVQSKQLPRMIQGWLNKQRFRQDEAAWFDLEEAFADHPGVIRKEAILEYMDFMQPEIVERTLAQREPDDYDSYVEMVDALEEEFGLVSDVVGNELPNDGDGSSIYDSDGAAIGFFAQRSPNEYRVIFTLADKQTEPQHMDFQAVPGGVRFRNILLVMPRKPGRFRSKFKHSHYPEHENVLASALVVDMYMPDGTRTMHILEYQSDWHQLGRAARSHEIDRLMHLEKITKEEATARVPKDWGYVSPEGRMARERAQAAVAHGLPTVSEDWLDNVLGTPEQGEQVEAAPFANTWPVIMMRRLVNQAVRGGYGWVTFSTGEQVADLYSKRSTVDEVYYEAGRGYLLVTNPDGNSIISQLGTMPHELQGIIGKEMSDKIKAQLDEIANIRAEYSVSEEPDPDSGEYTVYDPNGEIVRNWIGDPITIAQPEDIAEVFNYNSSLPGGSSEVTLKGEAITIGGESLIRFYNQETPQKINKYLSKLDENATVRDVTIDSAEGPVTVHGFPITEQLRGRIQERGQVLWRRQEGKADTINEKLQNKVGDKELKRIVADILRPLTSALPRLKPKIVVSPRELPAHLYQRMVEDGALGSKGLYDGDTDTVYIIASNHTSAEDIIRSALHEGVAHKGLRALLPEAELNELLDDVYATAEIPDAFKERFPDDEEGHRLAAEEWIARSAETQPDAPFVQRVVDMLRRVLRNLGLVRTWQRDDIYALLRDTRSALAGFRDAATVTITQQAEIAETGEIVEIEQQGDVALRQVQKRVGVVESLRECIAS
jgi:hypothetical protein